MSFEEITKENANLKEKIISLENELNEMKQQQQQMNASQSDCKQHQTHKTNDYKWCCCFSNETNDYKWCCSTNNDNADYLFWYWYWNWYFTSEHTNENASNVCNLNYCSECIVHCCSGFLECMENLDCDCDGDD